MSERPFVSLDVSVIPGVPVDSPDDVVRLVQRVLTDALQPEYDSDIEVEWTFAAGFGPEDK